MTALPANLPNIAGARLPAAYEAAKAALANCARIDECKDWADKAEALASYAKQANNDELRRMADRIQARAIQRCGELLREIEAQPGQRTDKPREGDHPRLTRTKAAADAGLSEHQRKSALRIANIPEHEFDQLVESPAPPTVTQLAEIGKKKGRRSPEEVLAQRQRQLFDQALGLIGGLANINHVEIPQNYYDHDQLAEFRVDVDNTIKQLRIFSKKLRGQQDGAR